MLSIFPYKFIKLFTGISLPIIPGGAKTKAMYSFSVPVTFTDVIIHSLLVAIRSLAESVPVYSWY
jgi:hypothetical protein